MGGDPRIGDAMDDVKDADYATLNMDPLRYFYKKEEMKLPTHARSGPDWSTYCSNWYTAWERITIIIIEIRLLRVSMI